MPAAERRNDQLIPARMRRPDLFDWNTASLSGVQLLDLPQVEGYRLPKRLC